MSGFKLKSGNIGNLFKGIKSKFQKLDSTLQNLGNKKDGSALGKLNIKSPDRSSPTSQQAYQQAQRKRFGHQKESTTSFCVRPNLAGIV